MEVDGGLGPIAQAQAGKEVGDVVFDGFFRNVEGLGDFAIAGSLGDQLEDFFFSWGEFGA